MRRRSRPTLVSTALSRWPSLPPQAEQAISPRPRQVSMPGASTTSAADEHPNVSAGATSCGEHGSMRSGFTNMQKTRWCLSRP
jgi:hypothetical protein